MVSSGMHVKFPKYFLKDFIQFWFVTLAVKRKDGHGRQFRRMSVRIEVGQLPEDERCVKLRPFCKQ